MHNSTLSPDLLLQLEEIQRQKDEIEARMTERQQFFSHSQKIFFDSVIQEAALLQSKKDIYIRQNNLLLQNTKKLTENFKKKVQSIAYADFLLSEQKKHVFELILEKMSKPAPTTQIDHQPQEISEESHKNRKVVDHDELANLDSEILRINEEIHRNRQRLIEGEKQRQLQFQNIENLVRTEPLTSILEGSYETSNVFQEHNDLSRQSFRLAVENYEVSPPRIVIGEQDHQESALESSPMFQALAKKDDNSEEESKLCNGDNQTEPSTQRENCAMNNITVEKYVPDVSHNLSELLLSPSDQSIANIQLNSPTDSNMIDLASRLQNHELLGENALTAQLEVSKCWIKERGTKKIENQQKEEHSLLSSKGTGDRLSQEGKINPKTEIFNCASSKSLSQREKPLEPQSSLLDQFSHAGRPEEIIKQFALDTDFSH